MNSKIAVVFIAALLLHSCATGKGYIPAAVPVPRVSEEMNLPGYWIKSIENPDTLIMDSAQIKIFNKDIRDRLGLVCDITEYQENISGNDVSEQIRDKFVKLGSPLYFKGGEKVDKPFFNRMERLVNKKAIPEIIKVKFGIITSYSALRELPFPGGLFAEKNDDVYDELQVTALDTGWLVAILHESADGRWLFVRCPYHYGWVEKEKTALCSRGVLAQFTESETFIVITAPKAEIFDDVSMKKYSSFIQMGARIPLVKEHDDSYEVKFPVRNEDGSCGFEKGFVLKSVSAKGYLPFTQINAIIQAFKMLNTPYSWGGASGGQDCSGFVQEVFMTFGIYLPRDSSQQNLTGFKPDSFNINLSSEDKIFAIKKYAVPGITLLFMKGHVMLYLGMNGSNPYVIHNIWSYREKDGSREKVMLIKKVAVTDLQLGKGSAKGSLLDRVNSLSLIKTGE
jgi:hypothetical protein